MSATFRYGFALIAMAIVIVTANEAVAQNTPFDPAPAPVPGVPRYQPPTATPALPPSLSGQPTTPVPPQPAAAPASDGRTTLELRDGSRLIGELAEIKAFNLKTAFGELAIPAKKIQGIRIGDYPAGNGEHSGTILFDNGDVLSGKLVLTSIKLKAKWGLAEIPLQQISSVIMSAQRMTWTRSGGWSLVPGNQIPYGTTPYAPPTAGAPSFSTQSVYRPDLR